MESNSVCNHTSDNKIGAITKSQRESDLFITSMITDRIGRHEVQLPINHKNYNFQEKKIAKLCKNRKFTLKTDKGCINCLMSL